MQTNYCYTVWYTQIELYKIMLVSREKVIYSTRVGQWRGGDTVKGVGIWVGIF